MRGRSIDFTRCARSGKHVAKRLQCPRQLVTVKRTTALAKPCFADAADLIGRDLTITPARADIHTIWPVTNDGRHRGNDHCLKVSVHLIWRDHDARPGLADLGSLNRLTSHQPDFAALHAETPVSRSVGEDEASASSSSHSPSHSQSDKSSSSKKSGSRRLPASGSRACSIAASSQPARGSSTGSIIRRTPEESANRPPPAALSVDHHTPGFVRARLALFCPVPVVVVVEGVGAIFA